MRKNMVGSFAKKTSKGKAHDIVTSDLIRLQTGVRPEYGIHKYCHPARLSDEQKPRTFDLTISAILGKLNSNRKNLDPK
jgi:hypothetical protein